ncbi:protein of unknown function [Methylocaldum szegediense]|uniref:GCN5-related N-acetyltransferase n=1 Tax=Methylocaldum szegediense TaxID=73780 RepID=A0ABM9I8I1_9GAMM|nr:protein of unknown function [Methylocaldum szegediense]
MRRSGFQFACLTFVNGSGAFWARCGFRPVVLPETHAALLASYGEGAQYMRMQLPARAPHYHRMPTAAILVKMRALSSSSGSTAWKRRNCTAAG